MNKLNKEDFTRTCEYCDGQGGWVTQFSGPDICNVCDGSGEVFDDYAYEKAKIKAKVKEFIGL